MDRHTLGRIVRGHGIELAPMTVPWPVPKEARVTFVDALPREELIRLHQPKDPSRMVEVEVDDAHFLSRYQEGQFDFLLSSHVFEHMQSPLTALENWLRVVKPGAYLFLAIPDKNHTFDRESPLTPYREALAMRVLFMLNGPSEYTFSDQHHTVWDAPSLRRFFELTQEIFGGFRLEGFYPEGFEVFVVLRKETH